MNLKILDCTLRDGGHLNNWQFDDDCVRASYAAAFKSGVDYFEIGYKVSTSVLGRGKYGYCSDDVINALMRYSNQCKLLCMIDSNKYDESISLSRKELTPFSGVRIATYPNDLEVALSQVEEFYDKGYEVFLNLMVFSEWQDSQWQLLDKWKNKHQLQAIYFVDSFGNYVPQDVVAPIKKLQSLGFDRIGFHGHNNLQMAFANSLKAIEAGATYVDASIFGMGRGAGNLPMEILLSYLNRQNPDHYNVVPYLDVIERFFSKLWQDLGWGYSLDALLAGVKNIHPYYVSELSKLNTYTVEELWNALDCIKEKCPISYSGEKLQDAMKERFYVPTEQQAGVQAKLIEAGIKIFPSEDAFKLDTLAIKDRHVGKKFLIIANGPSIKKYHDQIQQLINQENVITIGCNYLQGLFVSDYHVFVSKKRFLKYVDSVNPQSILVVPTFFGKKIIEENYHGKTEYVEVELTDDQVAPSINGLAQQCVYLNVAINAILSAYQMGAQEIITVGLDGYESCEPGKMVYFYDENDVPEDKLTASVRYENIVNELARVNGYLLKQGIPFSIITPTSHKRYYKKVFD